MKTFIKCCIGLMMVLFATGCTNQKADRLDFGGNQAAGIASVRLLHGPFKEAQERDLAYLKRIDPDRLLATFRQTAGLEPLAPGYTGWEDRELRGHFTGHYLSACSMMWAATGDTVMKERVRYILSQLRECQQVNGDGYISAFPRAFIDRVEGLEQVWAPYYTLHKILAGLTDAYIWCSDTTGLEVAGEMADWISSRCSKLSETDMQKMLDQTEQGGMNDVLYQLYALTGKPHYRELAERFYQRSYFVPLAEYRDTLKGQHVNSFIPNVIGLARGFELTGNAGQGRIARFFWETVTGSRSFVTGGTSNGEIWGSDNHHIHSELGPTSHESCCTYNMLKLTRHLWEWNHDPAYSDYYERALWNGILPTQHPASGMSMYYVPMAPGFYKTFGKPDSSFWCCTGTGVENFARTGECIYHTEGDRVFVDQFISSELAIDSLGFSIVMQTNFPQEEVVGLQIRLREPAEFDLRIRIPGWISADPELALNGKVLDYSAGPSSYFSIRRVWKNGDRISITLPMSLRLECLPDSPDTCAILYGPVVLAGKLGTMGLSDQKTYGHYGPYEDQPVGVPVLLAAGLPSAWISRVDGHGLEFKARVKGGDSVGLIPFYQLFDQRYTVYWPVTGTD